MISHRHWLFKIELTAIEYSPSERALPVSAALLGESLSTMTVAGFGVIVVGFGIIGAPELAPVARRSRHRLRAWVREHGFNGGGVLRSGH